MRTSIIIPSRNEPYLNKTLADVLAKAAGDVEVLAVLDGAPETAPLPEDKRIRVLRNDVAQGIGAATWSAAQVATGEHIMKIDAHCMFAPGFDVALQADCDDNWLVVPGRYQLLDAPDWHLGYGPIHYLYLTYPYLCEPQFGCGMHGKKWLGEDGLTGRYFYREKRDKAILLDDIITFQGSCWFMPRDYFIKIGGVEARYKLHQEATTLGMKVWLSGGRCVRNKKTWYAHLHKGQKHGRGYHISKRYSMESNRMAAERWMWDQWESRLRVRDIHWFVEHFNGIPGWPEDWDDPRYAAEFVWPQDKVAEHGQ